MKKFTFLINISMLLMLVACSTNKPVHETVTTQVKGEENSTTEIITFPTSTPRSIGAGYECPDLQISNLPTDKPVIIIRDYESIYQLGFITIYSDGRIETDAYGMIQVDSDCIAHLLTNIETFSESKYGSEYLMASQLLEENDLTIDFFMSSEEVFESLIVYNEDIETNPRLDSLIRRIHLFMQEADTYGKSNNENK